MFKVVISPAASKEFEDSIDFYNTKSPNLGTRFKVIVESKVHKISINPHQFKLINRQVRKAVVQDFPFIILFSIIEEKHIIIAHIYHTKRKPIKY